MTMICKLKTYVEIYNYPRRDQNPNTQVNLLARVELPHDSLCELLGSSHERDWGSTKCMAIAPLRGLPKYMSHDLMQTVQSVRTIHCASWLSLAELKAISTLYHPVSIDGILIVDATVAMMEKVENTILETDFEQNNLKARLVYWFESVFSEPKPQAP